MVASSPENNCFYLLVDVVENWIRDMAERFPNFCWGTKCLVGFERMKESKIGGPALFFCQI